MGSRNFDGIQFEELRKKVDGRFNDVHDELSDCYYGGKPFRSYGVLAKDRFDRLHGLIWHLHEIALDGENAKQEAKENLDLDLAGARQGVAEARELGLALEDLE
jgi:hypothetical protein